MTGTTDINGIFDRIIKVGCDPVIEIRLNQYTTPGGTEQVSFTLVSDQQDNVDIDALFFDLADGVDPAQMRIFPNEGLLDPANGKEVTGFGAGDDAFTTVSDDPNAPQLKDSYDVRVQFGTESAGSTDGAVDATEATFYITYPGDFTIDMIDLDSLTIVSDTTAFTTGNDGSGVQVPVQVIASEDFDDIHRPDQSDLIASDDHWIVHDDKLVTNGNYDGNLVFEPVDTEGPVSFTFDASACGLRNFEATGHYADSLRIEVQIDGGQWVLLDEFVVNHDNSALVGSETGQQITAHEGQISYEGGLLDTASDSAQFRIVSDISACDEIVKIDNVEIATTEIVEDGATETKTVAEADFDGLHYATQSDEVRWNDGWQVTNGELEANGHNDGNIWFEAVDLEGEAEICFDARAPHTNNFENGGHYGDSLEVWALIDGHDWELLDTFVVNHEGTALVGDTTGQTITADSQTLSYSGGALENANSVQLVLDADISAGNEEIFIDNYSVKDTCPDDGCEGFENAQAGDIVSDQFEGFTVSAQKAGDGAGSANDAMIFDTANPTGGDHDLGFANQGNAIIISEDGDSHDPDDNAHGGTISFDFDEPANVDSITLLDIEENGGTIDLLDSDGAILNTVPIPGVGDNTAQDIVLNTEGVSSMNVNLVGSGAVDDLCFEFTKDCGQYELDYTDLMTQSTDDTDDGSNDDDWDLDPTMMNAA